MLFGPDFKILWPHAASEYWNISVVWYYASYSSDYVLH